MDHFDMDQCLVSILHVRSGQFLRLRTRDAFAMRCPIRKVPRERQVHENLGGAHHAVNVQMRQCVGPSAKEALDCE